MFLCGQYVEVLVQFYQVVSDSVCQLCGGYYGDYVYVNDMVYVVECVLIIDELKIYVDVYVLVLFMLVLEIVVKVVQKQGGGLQLVCWVVVGLLVIIVEDNLCQLLVWCLVCDGCVEEVLFYFLDDCDECFIQSIYDVEGYEVLVGWCMCVKVCEYGQVLDCGQYVWCVSSCVQGWYEVVVIVCCQGMEIMGYEQGLDYVVYGGSYFGGVGCGMGMYGNEDKLLLDNL